MSDALFGLVVAIFLVGVVALIFIMNSGGRRSAEPRRPKEGGTPVADNLLYAGAYTGLSADTDACGPNDAGGSCDAGGGGDGGGGGD
jgi:hypothetical protein